MEKINCAFQNECQSAFFDQVQVTVDPMILYYYLDDNIDDRTLVQHAMIAISDYLKHDALTVKSFENLAMQSDLF